MDHYYIHFVICFCYRNGVCECVCACISCFGDNMNAKFLLTVWHFGWLCAALSVVRPHQAFQKQTGPPCMIWSHNNNNNNNKIRLVIWVADRYRSQSNLVLFSVHNSKKIHTESKPTQSELLSSVRSVFYRIQNVALARMYTYVRNKMSRVWAHKFNAIWK